MRLALCALFAASAVLTGCYSTPYYLQNNAAGALDCPESDVKVDDGTRISKHARAYTASGCGRTVTYVCPNLGTDCE